MYLHRPSSRSTSCGLSRSPWPASNPHYPHWISLLKKSWSSTFATGIAAMQASDPDQPEYLRQIRQWSERLVGSRNDMKHAAQISRTH